MPNLKRLRRKRQLQKQANIRQMALKNLLGTERLTDWMSQHHEDVLQNIEFTLVNSYREDPFVDDAVVAVVLKSGIRGDPLSDECAVRLSGQLEEMREFRSDISDEVWRDGLRVVLQSVHRHSNARPGSTGYLSFVSDFF